MVGTLRLAAARCRAWVLNPMGRNPYDEGSSDSYFWKLERGFPRSAEDPEPLFEDVEEVLRSSGVLLAKLQVLDDLIANLPKQILEDLNATDGAEHREKLQELLDLARYRREHTSIKIARNALVISAIAGLISAATLGVAVWALILQHAYN